jgi:hypothetical protein
MKEGGRERGKQGRRAGGSEGRREGMKGGRKEERRKGGNEFEVTFGPLWRHFWVTWAGLDGLKTENVEKVLVLQ